MSSAGGGMPGSQSPVGKIICLWLILDFTEFGVGNLELEVRRLGSICIIR